MKVAHSITRDMTVGIRFDSEAERFRISYVGAARSRDNGLPLVVTGILAMIDLPTGEVQICAYGCLVNKDGAVGERTRDMPLEADQIPEAVKYLIAAEFQTVQDRVSAVGGVTFK